MEKTHIVDRFFAKHGAAFEAYSAFAWLIALPTYAYGVAMLAKDLPWILVILLCVAHITAWIGLGCRIDRLQKEAQEQPDLQ